MFANEPYLQEFVSETLRVGYDHIVMLDANKDEKISILSRELLKPWIEMGKVSYQNVKYPSSQGDPRVRCAHAQAKMSSWITIQDVDEILTIQTNRSLQEILAPFDSDPEIGGVAVNWRFRYPTSFRRQRSCTMFDMCPLILKGYNENVKTFLKVQQPDNVIPLTERKPGYMHYCACSEHNLKLVTLHGERLPDNIYALKGWGAEFHYSIEMYWDHYSLRGTAAQGFAIKASRGNEPYYSTEYLKNFWCGQKKQEKERIQRKYQDSLVPYNFDVVAELEAQVVPDDKIITNLEAMLKLC